MEESEPPTLLTNGSSWNNHADQENNHNDVHKTLTEISTKEQNGVNLLNGGHTIIEANGDLPCKELSLVPASVDQAVDRTLLDDDDYTCGLCSFKPRWLQPFANKKAFLVVFCLTSVLQGMYYTYFVSVLTTIEKLYQIQSKTTGIIMSATEIGQIGGALLLTYYGGHGHRPKWIACGMLVFAVASILCSTPHFLFGVETAQVVSSSRTPPDDEWNTKLCRTKVAAMFPADNGSFTGDLTRNSTVMHVVGNLTGSGAPMRTFDFAVYNNSNMSDHLPLADAFRTHRAKCESEENAGNQARIKHVVLTIFFISLLFIGIGATAVYTLGIPYIDDNVATRESPLYFGITIGVRIFGPVFGFLLGSLCTSVTVDFPFNLHMAGDESIRPSDPQWIGAWWLGVFIVGAALILTSFPMMAFPRKLHHSGSFHGQFNRRANGVVCSRHQHHQALLNNRSPKKEVTKPSLKDFPAAMRRLLKNDVLLCRTASSVLHILPIAGLYTFLPKYLESQFQLTATKANMISGMAGILVMGAGIFASGTFMRKYKPNARFVARWIAAAALSYAIGMVSLMWLGCPLNNYVGLNAGSGAVLPPQPNCNNTCECQRGDFTPICTSEGVTYLSPCLAGCMRMLKVDEDQYTSQDCHCLGQNVTATSGFCPLDCNNLTWYIVLFAFFVLVHSTSEVGSMLLTLRCVDPQDKAMALGLISFAIGLFGNVPCPIIYGAVVDSACLFWEDNCGKPGACRVYDPVKFRMVFHGITAVIMFAAFLVDAVVCYKATCIQFHEDEETAQPEETEAMNKGSGAQFETSV